MNNRLASYISLEQIIIVKEEVRSGGETSRNPRAYTERSPRRYVRTLRPENLMNFFFEFLQELNFEVGRCLEIG